MTLFLSLFSLWFCGPAVAGTRTAVVARVPAADATPTGGSWATLVENSAQIVAGDVRDTEGLELALPRDWSKKSNVLYTPVDLAWSDGRILASLEDADVAQVFVVERLEAKVKVRRLHGTGPTFELGAVAPPASRESSDYLAFEAALGEVVETGAEPLVPVELVVVDGSDGKPMPEARVEVRGFKIVSGGARVLLPRGTYALSATGGAAYLPTVSELRVTEGAETVRIELRKKARLTVQAPKRAVVSVDGQSCEGPCTVLVTPERPLTVLVRKGNRQRSTTVKLKQGAAHTEKVRLPLFGG